jgi:hypothetical protein
LSGQSRSETRFVVANGPPFLTEGALPVSLTVFFLREISSYV